MIYPLPNPARPGSGRWGRGITERLPRGWGRGCEQRDWPLQDAVRVTMPPSLPAPPRVPTAAPPLCVRPRRGELGTPARLRAACDNNTRCGASGAAQGWTHLFAGRQHSCTVWGWRWVRQEPRGQALWLPLPAPNPERGSGNPDRVPLSIRPDHLAFPTSLTRQLVR